MTATQGKTIAIIPAAGAGVRMGCDRAKQFLELDGMPILARTLKPFQASPSIDSIIVVVPAANIPYCRFDIVERFNLDKVTHVVPGGERRQDSVRLGIEAAPKDCARVLIHDGVRPFVQGHIIDGIVEQAKIHRAVITGLAARETVKEVGKNLEVVRTYDRKQVWLIQTPQIFRYEDILAAHQKAFCEGWEESTDDSALIERLGIPVKVIEGSETNIKVTTPNDLELARFLLGYDRVSDINS
jgi:2-C-methyl-D-erythritol 4-phosphate cytidylyltransferase